MNVLESDLLTGIEDDVKPPARPVRILPRRSMEMC